MNVLIQLKQNNNAAYLTLKPLVSVPFVKRVYAIRDSPGYKMNKLTYIYPHSFFLKNSLLRTLSKTFLMIKYSYKYKPDVLIGIDMVPHALNAVICSKIFKIRVIGSLRGMPEEYYLDNNKYFMNFILKELDLLTTTGSNSRRWMSKKINSRKIVILPNGIDTSKFKSWNGIREFDVINIGRLHKSKNIDLFIRIISDVKKKIPQIRAAIIGDGPEKATLEKLTKKLGVEKNIMFLGFQKNPEQFYRRAKIFLLPTKREGLPFALIEAMCCGCVPVISDIGDISDVCVNQVNSILVKNYNDSKQFEQAIINLMNSKKFLTELSDNAKNIKKSFSFKSAEETWEKIFEKLNLEK